MLQNRDFLRKVIKCEVTEGTSTHQPPYKKKTIKIYTYFLECGHIVVRRGQLSGERSSRQLKSIICPTCVDEGGL